MKRSLYFLFLLCLVSCDQDINFTDETNSKVPDGVNFIVQDFIFETGQSRSSIDQTGNFSWSVGDTLGVFPINGLQTAFPISGGTGTSTAQFNGGDWALRPNAQYATYFPYQGKNYLDKGNIVVDYTGQTQTRNNSTEHLGKYDYIASCFTDVDGGGNANFQLSHLGALVKISIVMPEADSYSKLTVSTDAGNFKTVARYGLSNTTPSLTAVTTATSVEMDLSGISTSAPNQSIILYMMMAPANLSSATLTFSVTGSKSYTGTASGKNMAAGSAYAYSVTCEAPAITHEYVDLGLPSGTLWATCNVGANAPEEYGDYFAWGETEPYYTEGHSQNNPCENWKAGKSGYNWSNYKWCNNGSWTGMTKYTIADNQTSGIWYSGSTFVGDNKTVLESADDAATANWGAGWKMPTQAQMQELYDYTTRTWTSLNGVNGWKFTAKNGSGNFVFLPAAGYRGDGYLGGVGSFGLYWSSSLYSDRSYYAYYLYFYSECVYPSYKGYRYFGQSVRPVRDSAPVEHEYVDLGLPSGTKWATCNIGATNPEEYGDYFAWGETEPYYTEGHSQDDPCENWKAGKSGYNWANYKWCNGSYTTLTKYCTSSSYGTVDNKTVLESADDAATANWGAGWKMPTQAQMQELYDYTTCTWTSLNGVNGWKFTAKNGSGNFVFLPAAGYRASGGSLIAVGSDGFYWSSSLDTGYSNYAFILWFDSGYGEPNGKIGRCYGFPVRPVRGL